MTARTLKVLLVGALMLSFGSPASQAKVAQKTLELDLMAYCDGPIAETIDTQSLTLPAHLIRVQHRGVGELIDGDLSIRSDVGPIDVPSAAVARINSVARHGRVLRVSARTNPAGCPANYAWGFTLPVRVVYRVSERRKPVSRKPAERRKSGSRKEAGRRKVAPRKPARDRPLISRVAAVRAVLNEARRSYYNDPDARDYGGYCRGRARWARQYRCEVALKMRGRGFQSNTIGWCYYSAVVRTSRGHARVHFTGGVWSREGYLNC